MPDGGAVEQAVREIIERVRVEGDVAVLDYTRRFDATEADRSELGERGLLVSQEQLDEAIKCLPLDLVARLQQAVEAGADLACAASDGQSHPVFGLWPLSLREALRRAVVEEGVRKVDQWTGRCRLATVSFAAAPVDPFFNANRPDDLAEAERLAASAEPMRAG